MNGDGCGTTKLSFGELTKNLRGVLTDSPNRTLDFHARLMGGGAGPFRSKMGTLATAVGCLCVLCAGHRTRAY